MVLDSWRMTHTGLSGLQMTGSHSVIWPTKERDAKHFSQVGSLKRE